MYEMKTGIGWLLYPKVHEDPMPVCVRNLMKDSGLIKEFLSLLFFSIKWTLIIPDCQLESTFLVQNLIYEMHLCKRTTRADTDTEERLVLSHFFFKSYTTSNLQSKPPIYPISLYKSVNYYNPAFLPASYKLKITTRTSPRLVKLMPTSYGNCQH